MGRFNNERESGGDVYDQATRLSDMLLEASLASQLGSSGPESHPDFDGNHCVDCDTDIPTARLVLGKVRCVPCQEYLEHERKLHGRA